MKNKINKHQLIKSIQHKIITKPQVNVRHEDLELESRKHSIYVGGFGFYNFLK